MVPPILHPWSIGGAIILTPISIHATQTPSMYVGRAATVLPRD
jgi:hypothetical protein